MVFYITITTTSLRVVGKSMMAKTREKALAELRKQIKTGKVGEQDIQTTQTEEVYIQ